jgi:hypothetical protein
MTSRDEVKARFGITDPEILSGLIIESVGWEYPKGKRNGHLPREVWRIRPRRKGEGSNRSPGELFPGN